jgi:nicotinamidase-related amidase
VSKSYWEWRPVFRLDRRRVGLLIIDMQNGFVEEGAPLELPMAREQVPTLKRLLGFFRKQGLPVFFTQFCVSDQFNYPFYWNMAEQRGLRLEPPDRMFWPDKHETQVIADLAPLPGEPVIRKAGYDAFANTELEQYLATRKLEQLVIAGTVINWCVDSTVRTAYHRSYQVLVAADGVSAYAHAQGSAEDWHRMELDLFAEAFGRVARVEEIISELSAGG